MNDNISCDDTGSDWHVTADLAASWKEKRPVAHGGSAEQDSGHDARKFEVLLL